MSVFVETLTVIVEGQKSIVCGDHYGVVQAVIAYLKVPKCEIFHLFDFNDFYGIKSL